MSVSGQTRNGFVSNSANVYASGTATSNGTTYVQLVASTSSAVYITHFYKSSTDTYIASLATGAAGSETVVAVFSGPPNMYALRYPIRVPASTRIAVKLNASEGVPSVMSIAYTNESSVY